MKTLYWKKGELFILEQRLLPGKVAYVRCRNHKDVARCIKDMVIRGAPAIGVAAAYGVALAAGEKKFRNLIELKKYIWKASALLASTRPTAVNLFWGIERMKRIAANLYGSVKAAVKELEMEAEAVYFEDIEINKKLGDYGAELIKKNSVILTHCNAGALATAGYGTALGVIRSARRDGKVNLVYVDETRPYLQGARLTAWELKQDKIPHCLITDNMAGYFMGKGEIDAVVVGADRIAANGDTANKIGTYSLSILAKYHKIPFYIAAPVSTIDLRTPSGREIKIEERSTDEVIYIKGNLIAPKGTVARHPGFDVTPARNITAIITENGVFQANHIKNALK
ncbi:MAG: S-methyl-5-thioribose-1-phosphate isomerase [Elusimicrobiota bacterium]